MSNQDEEELLIDANLEADPDADEELGGGDVEQVADEDIKGSRLLLVRRVAESIDLNGKAGGVVQLVCTFQPAAGARFTSAQVRLRLIQPDGVRIVDLAPRSLNDPNPVEFELNKKGQLAVKNLPLAVSLEPGVEIGSSKKFTRYSCMVQGSGEGTSLARWDFKENPDRRDGIGPEHVLVLTLPVTGTVVGSATVSARLVRPGLGGQVDAIRDLILRKSAGKAYPIQFEIPQTPRQNLLAQFFRF